MSDYLAAYAYVARWRTTDPARSAAVSMLANAARHYPRWSDADRGYIDALLDAFGC